MGAPFTILIGYANTSSWSMRGWLALKKSGLPFEERFFRYRTEEGKAALRRESPHGKLPVLFHDRPEGRVAVWESVAICDYVAEQAPGAGLWPEDPVARAFARSVAAEMHAGFMAMRNHLSMELTGHHPGQGLDQPGVAADLERIRGIWTEARQRWGVGGPYLFGRYTLADAMYAPVVTRFRTYEVPLDPVSHAYCEAMLEEPAFLEWQAKVETQPLDM